jgi:ElaB/YqjD/DUF883 family membrane-anchored ribosome-binding protein
MAERNNLIADWREPASNNAERTADEIRQDIAARRESITEAVDRLGDRVQETFDWRTHVSNYPLAALGVAAGMGFLLARVFKPRPSSGQRIKDALAYGIEDLTGRFRHRLDDLDLRKPGFSLGGTVKAAATGLITKAVTDYLRNRYTTAYERYPEYMSDYSDADRDSL